MGNGELESLEDNSGRAGSQLEYYRHQLLCHPALSCSPTDKVTQGLNRVNWVFRIYSIVKTTKKILIICSVQKSHKFSYACHMTVSTDQAVMS